MGDNGRRWRVVVVDDHPIVLAGLKAVLGESPALELCGSAGTGAEALEVCRQVRPDVVLLDIRLPDLSGTEVCREIKLSLPGVKVLFLTSYSDEANVLTGMAAGGDGYLLKTITGEDIGGAVAKVAAGGCLLDPSVARTFVKRAADASPLELGGVELANGELRLLEMVTQGLLNKEIASRLGIAEKTVRNQLTPLFAKLGVQTRAQAAAWMARQRGHPGSGG